MTEREWLTTDRFREMMAFVVGAVQPSLTGVSDRLHAALARQGGAAAGTTPGMVPSDRKLRLLAAACSRHLWPAVDGVWADRAEWLADGRSDRAEPGPAGRCTAAVAERAAPTTPEAMFPALAGAGDRPREVWRLGLLFDLQALFPDASPVGCGVVRDVFGNPFRPPAFDPRWRTAPALDLARGMYEAKDFTAMPVLADALEEAGCDNADILTHCRGSGPHVRGCWVLDLVSGHE